jgi:cobyrinic acid a,c-diamide synthase
MTPPRLTLGYAEVEIVGDTPLGRAGTVARGHAFHCSTLDPVPAHVRRAYRVRSGERTSDEGYLVGSALMSYVHLHFASNPALAGVFVRAAARPRGARHGHCV